MIIQKEYIQRLVKEHKISSFKEHDEEEFSEIIYRILSSMPITNQFNVATKDDIKMVIERMDKRFEALISGLKICSNT